MSELGRPHSWLIGRLVALSVGAAPLLIGAFSVLTDAGVSPYRIAAGMVGAIVGGVANASVLLVEIQR